VLDVMHATGLFDYISQRKIFATADMALTAIHAWAAERGQHSDASPLRPVSQQRFA
jgi:hypothetical protein